MKRISLRALVGALLLVFAGQSSFARISNLWLAVAADMGASLFVTFNALRLLRTKELPK